jgi:hypothetical protein
LGHVESNLWAHSPCAKTWARHNAPEVGGARAGNQDAGKSGLIVRTSGVSAEIIQKAEAIGAPLGVAVACTVRPRKLVRAHSYKAAPVRARHFQKFLNSRMCAAIIAHDEAGGAALDPTARAAVGRRRSSRTGE